jgi:hypothetical protein
MAQDQSNPKLNPLSYHFIQCRALRNRRHQKLIIFKQCLTSNQATNNLPKKVGLGRAVVKTRAYLKGNV